MTTYLVSGATGFLGQALLPALAASGLGAARLTRAQANGTDIAAGDDFRNIERAWPSTFRPDCVIHLAARVHVMRDTVADPMSAFRAVNVEATLRVAEAAARRATRRFVYISSIKAAGEFSGGQPLRESEASQPEDPYGVSKREAEIALLDLGRRTGMEIAILRPPLVYGPGVGANFLSLMRAVARGWPLPLGSASAPRSLVAVDNLASAIIACAAHPAAAGEIFHVCDAEEVSVAELVRLIAAALDTRARLLPVPPSVLRVLGAITGKPDAVRRLIEPLRVDNRKLRTLLEWTPPISLIEGLKRTAAWYRSTSSDTPTNHP
jgi:nucleoside-diphosphate-sugar epimerase